MSDFAESSSVAGDAKYFVRWRGRQEGPYPDSVIETKLAANEIGLLHEVFYNEKWITIRDYLAAREVALHAALQAREEQERQARDEADRQAQERDEQQRSDALAEEQRRNDILAASLVRQNPAPVSPALPHPLRPHRAGVILALGLVGLFVCGPLCLVAWVMGSSDLGEMNAGTMDPSGRSVTRAGRIIGISGTILWVIGIVLSLVVGISINHQKPNYG